MTPYSPETVVVQEQSCNNVCATYHAIDLGVPTAAV